MAIIIPKLLLHLHNARREHRARKRGDEINKRNNGDMIPFPPLGPIQRIGGVIFSIPAHDILVFGFLVHSLLLVLVRD